MQLAFILGIGFLGLLIGSFLNVVIFRLPQMIDDSNNESSQTALSLLLPPSHCPKCQHHIAWYHNIPVLSYLWLKGKCHHCRQKISLRYPTVELLTMVLSMAVAARFDLTYTAFGSLFLVWALIALTFIDLDHTLLPDDITLPLLWLGLIFNTYSVFTPPASAILGAACGYLVLWTVYWLFKAVTHKEGMGYGDFKLLAMLGAWLGWKALPFILVSSSLMGSIFGICLIIGKGKNKDTPIPFGPFLAISGLIALFWGPQLNDLYFRLIFR